MRLRLLLVWQILTGLSDTGTGLLLIFAPAFTLRLMGVHAQDTALPFLAPILSWMGAFVLSVGLACLYGGTVVRNTQKIETVWLLTSITRSLVALVVALNILNGALDSGWISVPIADFFIAAVQVCGLLRGWLKVAADR